ncbi:methyltransferase [Natronobiforma cellulositropha]|uniref:methyltransferase n=1 Tax=Natronobiforma cellulositropha TaxID=1679076 RepID=UPI0021D5ADA1|nr:methyltransferase [Natronobiforma cellulositropha]
MKGILAELGWRDTLGSRLFLVSLFGSVTVALLVTRLALESLLGVPALAGLLLGWACWFCWLGILFPRRQERHLEYGSDAYVRAFWTDILFGVSFGVSLILTPLAHARGLREFDAAFALGVAALAAGGLLLYAGFDALGLDGAGFLFEYRPVEAPLVEEGIYTYLHHPLFLGGLLAALGVAVLVADRTGLTLALVSTLLFPVYRALENRRLSRVCPDAHAAYTDTQGSTLE